MHPIRDFMILLFLVMMQEAGPSTLLPVTDG
jgi:hypothetical protein